MNKTAAFLATVALAAILSIVWFGEKYPQTALQVSYTLMGAGLIAVIWVVLYVLFNTVRNR